MKAIDELGSKSNTPLVGRFYGSWTHPSGSWGGYYFPVNYANGDCGATYIGTTLYLEKPGKYRIDYCCGGTDSSSNAAFYVYINDSEAVKQTFATHQYIIGAHTFTVSSRTSVSVRKYCSHNGSTYGAALAIVSLIE